MMALCQMQKLATSYWVGEEMVSPKCQSYTDRRSPDMQHRWKDNHANQLDVI